MCVTPLGHERSAATNHRRCLCAGQGKLMLAGRADRTAGSCLLHYHPSRGKTEQRAPGICSPVDALTCHLEAGWRPPPSEPHSMERAERAALSPQRRDGAPCPGLSLVPHAGSVLQGAQVLALRSPHPNRGLNPIPPKPGSIKRASSCGVQTHMLLGSQSRGKHSALPRLHPGTKHLAPNCSVRTSPYK